MATWNEAGTRIGLGLDRTAEYVLARLWNKRQCSKGCLALKKNPKQSREVSYLKRARMILGKVQAYTQFCYV